MQIVVAFALSTGGNILLQLSQRKLSSFQRRQSGFQLIAVDKLVSQTKLVHSLLQLPLGGLPSRSFKGADNFGRSFGLCAQPFVSGHELVSTLTEPNGSLSQAPRPLQSE